ncbi:MAG: hypothetical protein Q8R37_02195 [Nanoarchaeota archaeon]|nr:hypothetical protein [Nanoarchaeota archaeon]
MKEILLQLIIIAYAFDGIIGIIAYWPTIKDVYYNKPSANKRSYLIWTITGGTALLYSIFILSDFLLRVLTALNFLACATIYILSVRIKSKDAKKPKSL